MTQNTHTMLSKTTGLWGALVIGLGSILGTGAYVSVGLSSTFAGHFLVLAIAIAALTALCNGLSSAQLAAAHPVSGGTYEYGYRYLNPISGKLAGGLFVVAKSASAATAALAVTVFTLHVFEHVMPSTVNLNTVFVSALSIGLLLLFTFLVLNGVRRTNWLNTVLVLISVAGLLTFIIAAMSLDLRTASHQVTGSDNTVHEHLEVSWLSVSHAAALMFVAFTGYGRIATMGEEIIAPRRNIPQAVVITLTIISLLYVLLGLAILRIDTGQLVSNNYNIAYLLPDSIWQKIVLFGGITAMCGVILNLLLGVSRVILAMGRRGDLPNTFGKLSNDNQSAPAATWATFAVISVIIALGGIQFAWTLSALTVLLYYGITNLAALNVEKSKRFIPRWVSVIGLLSCFSLVVLSIISQLFV